MVAMLFALLPPPTGESFECGSAESGIAVDRRGHLPSIYTLLTLEN